jgi:hydrogenase maturation protein HypF
MELEVLSKPYILAATSYPYSVDDTQNGKIIRVHELFQRIVDDVRANKSIGLIGANFHKTISEMALDICRRACQFTGLREVALSGVVWQNQLLRNLVHERLQRNEFTVYFHKQVPTSDGGLSLGQAVIANHLISKRYSPEGVETIST